MLYTVDYQERDNEIIDYSNYELAVLPELKFRGPALDLSTGEGYITCIGAAQTHGVFVDNPYPQLLGQKYGMPVWNLGVGGAHPGFYLEHPKLFEYINKSRFVVLQVTTARCSANDRIGRSPYSAMGVDNRTGETLSAGLLWQRILAEEPENAQKYIAQSRASWRRDLEEMIERIRVPIIHFWFSPKSLGSKGGEVGREAAIDISKLDDYPQFITREDLKLIEGQLFATCHSNRNQRFPLLSKHTGEIVNLNWGYIRNRANRDWYETHNTYYPSPEMKWDAAEALGKIIDDNNLLG